MSAAGCMPGAWTHDSYPFAARRNFKIKGVPMLRFRICNVGEQGWELHFKYEDGLVLWDALYAPGRLRKVVGPF